MLGFFVRIIAVTAFYFIAFVAQYIFMYPA